ncbi:MAG: autotransporter outer membrane beta-barrel domain-containing protein, partial [Phycisphaerales bacterium]|nr:autotransporter outer membrane beta-barrel domain-containing protein [Phycisphaerales bacterium]
MMRRIRSRAMVLAVAAVVWAGGGLHITAHADTTDDRLRALEERLNRMDQTHKDELKKRDDEIAGLRQKLNGSESATQEALDRTKAIQNITAEIVKDLESRKETDTLNPEIAVIVDFVGNISSRNRDATRNRMDIRAVELDIRADITRYAQAVAVLAFERDIMPGLFEVGDDDGIDTEVQAEEAYLFLHDFGIPGLTAKIGRYRVKFGQQNLMHLHDLPTVNTPYVLQSFLAPEALSDVGLQLSYRIPNPWDEHFEITAEINSGEGGSSESPTLNGNASARTPSIVNHLLWHKHVNEHTYFELGLSNLWGHAGGKGGDEANRDVWLCGIDALFVHRDPASGFHQVLQTEAIYGRTRQPDGSTQTAWGAYLLGQQQFAQDWHAGLRLDYTQNANDSDEKIYGLSPYLTWYLNNNIRLRLQYEYRAGD